MLSLVFSSLAEEDKQAELEQLAAQYDELKAEYDKKFENKRLIVFSFKLIVLCS